MREPREGTVWRFLIHTIGLFTGLDPTVGGIEASAAVAWEVLRDGRAAELVAYDHTGRAVPAALLPATVHASKARLAAALLARRWPADTLVCWHVGLLKLVPLLRGFHGRVCLFSHGIEAWRPPGRLTRRQLDRVDLFLTNTDHTWERFLRFYPPAAGRPHLTTALGLGDLHPGPVPPPTDPPAALILGRTTVGNDYKGHRELIGCWGGVRDRVPGAELWVAGDGDLRPALEQLAARGGVAGAVRFLGRVTEARKAELLVGCRCLAMPSRGEGFGLVYLESMRVGRPCLVSDQDAGREVVNPPEAGVAVDPKNPTALAAAVAALLTAGPGWDDLSRAAKARYDRMYTAAHFRQRLAAAVYG